MNAVTAGYRRDNLALRARTIRDLQVVWPALDPRKLDATFPDWVQIAAAIVGRDRALAVQIAAGYLAAFRAAAGVDSEVVAPAPALTPEEFLTSMRVTSTVAVKKSMLAGKTVEEAMANAFVTNVGAATRIVLNAGRETVMGSAIADPECRGWQRVTSGGCDFCLMLAGRGGVYTESSVRFASHLHCGCSAEPVYGGTALSVDEYKPSLRRITGTQRAQVGRWLRENEDQLA